MQSSEEVVEVLDAENFSMDADRRLLLVFVPSQHAPGAAPAPAAPDHFSALAYSE